MVGSGGKGGEGPVVVVAVVGNVLVAAVAAVAGGGLCGAGAVEVVGPSDHVQLQGGLQHVQHGVHRERRCITTQIQRSSGTAVDTIHIK